MHLSLSLSLSLSHFLSLSLSVFCDFEIEKQADKFKQNKPS